MAHFKETLLRAKLRLLQLHYEKKIGHIGGNLSALDVILFLYHHVLKENDRFVLSKGHAAGALYVSLWSAGKLSDGDLNGFHKDGSKLSGHPAAGWCPEIPFSTGSLGHGLSLAAGVSLGMKIKNEEGRVFCLLSDGEWEEGSTWEALIFTAHHRLNNLTLLVDSNGLQGFGKTTDIASLEPLADKVRPFGIEVLEVNGHDPLEIDSAITYPAATTKMIILRTVKGKGVSFMEGKMEWHYLPMSKEQYVQAVREVSTA
jgi:transketolase